MLKLCHGRFSDHAMLAMLFDPTVFLAFHLSVSLLDMGR
jgi:hypothetical protein